MPHSSRIEEFIEYLNTHPHYRQNIAGQDFQPERKGEYCDVPALIHPEIRKLLSSKGINKLYVHQQEAIMHLYRRDNVLISSGVASGKSLCYQAPILSELLNFPASRSLLLYPTKALAQDQCTKMYELLTELKLSLGAKHTIKAGIYDGDTPKEQRTMLRKSASLLFSNPDMLHLGILPNHTLWRDFFANLRFVVIDEVHVYRGVFGSQFANVLRRLKRIGRLYGAKFQFVLLSATLANAQAFAEELIEAPLKVVDKDTSPRGARHFMILNPPMVNYDLGIRRSAIIESSSLAKRFLETQCQAILFTETRRNVEILFLYLLNKQVDTSRIRSYRSGYLPEERRAIEDDLRSGRVDIVVSTNALELGIDIGGLDAIFINGFPGTICSTIQQSGRAGRKMNTALTVLIATANPLDQYICRNPHYIFGNSPEQALIDPDNTDIILRHLHCAVAEMALIEGEAYGARHFYEIEPYLSILLEDKLIRKVGNRYLGNPQTYPAGNVSLRNMTSQYQLLYENNMVGYVDEESAFWMVHPDAIYLHRGETWIVNEMDNERRTIHLGPFSANYYTQANTKTDITLVNLLYSNSMIDNRKYLGRVSVTRETVGFKKIRLYTQEILGYEELDLPKRRIETIAVWIELAASAVERIREKGLWRNDPNDYGKSWKQIKEQIRKRDDYCCKHCGIQESGSAHDVHHIVPLRKFADINEANKDSNLTTLCPRCHHLAESAVIMQSGLAGVAFLLGNLAPLFVMSEPKDLGIHAEANSLLCNGNPAIILYDSIAGGIGLCKKLYHILDNLLATALNAVEDCPCEMGCPACVGPVAENGEGAKVQAQAILMELVKS